MNEPDDDELEEPQSPGRPGMPVDLTRLVRGIVLRWRWIAVVAVLSSALGVILAKTIAPKTYISRAVIVWERGGQESRQELRTLVDSMLIPVNLTEVKRRLKSAMSLEVLALSLDVFFDPYSDVVSLEASAATAQDATKLADTMVTVFLEHCAQLRRARADGALQEVRNNLDIAQATLANAQEVYDAFRRDNDITNLSEEARLAIQRAADLRSMADTARSDAQAESARASALENNARGERAMVVIGQTQSDPGASAVAAVRAELATARSRLSADHPRIAALEAQLQALQASGDGPRTIASTGQNVHLTAIKAAIAESSMARAAALERQQIYAERATQAREQLQKLSAVEGQAAILLSDVTNASHQVTELEAQLVQAERTARDKTADFRVLAAADTPQHPSSGKGKLYAAGIPAAAILLLLIGLVGEQLRGLRIHTAREAAFWINGPVIGASVWPRQPEALSELIDELADCAASASGNTLVVGASAGDEGAANEVARALRQRIVRGARSVDPDFGPRALFSHAEPSDARTTLAEIAAPSALSPVEPTAPTDAQASTAIQTWDTTQQTISMRRASRLSDRVVVVLTANTLPMARLTDVRTRLGRDHGIAVLLVGIEPALADLPDRVGDVDGFWYSTDYVDAG